MNKLFFAQPLLFCFLSCQPTNQAHSEEKAVTYEDTATVTSAAPEHYQKFQNAEFSGAQIQLLGSESTATVLPAPAPQSQALRLQARGHESAGVVVQLASYQNMNEELFGRSWLFLESTPEQSVHWNLLAAEGPRSDQLRASYALGGQHYLDQPRAGSQLMAHYETPDFYSGHGEGSDCWQHSSKQLMPVERWVCIEWHFSNKTNSMEFWIDEEKLESLHVEQSGQGCVHQAADYLWQAPQFERFWLGWQSFQDDAKRTLWVADLGLSSQGRLGCGSLEHKSPLASKAAEIRPKSVRK